MPWTFIPRIYIGTDQTLIDSTQSSVYTDLDGYLASQKIIVFPYTSTQVVSVTNANYQLIDDSMVAGNLSIFPGSTYISGIVSTNLPGAIGSGSLVTASDNKGTFINKVDIRDATTNDPILDLSGNVVYGLIQSASTVLDGDPIGASASENTQISFFSFDPTTEALQLVTLTGNIEFQINKLYNRYNIPELLLAGDSPSTEIIARPSYYYATLTVTTAFASSETINIQTGLGAISGVSTREGDAILLPNTQAIFDNHNEIEIYRNGKLLETHNLSSKEVTWISTTTIQINQILFEGDIITIKVPTIY